MISVITSSGSGRPWTVYGLLRTADSVSPSLTGANVVVSFIGYAVVYLVMYPVGVRYMLQVVQRGPTEPATRPEVIESGRPEHPVEALSHDHAGDPAGERPS